MKDNMSALADGELEPHESERVLAGLRGNSELCATWSAYQTIGAALRGERDLSRDITVRVMAGLEAEPTVLCPQPRRESARPRAVLSLAASAAGVAVVAWLAFSPQFSGGPERIDLARAPTARSLAADVTPTVQREMQEYLAAHQAYASSVQTPLVTQNIRTVAASGGVSRR